MKLSSIICASMIVAAAANVAFADDKHISDGAAKGQATEGTAQPTTCPTGEAWNATAKKCVAPSSINYNASKSNTVSATPLNNRSNVTGAAQPSSSGAPATPK